MDEYSIGFVGEFFNALGEWIDSSGIPYPLAVVIIFLAVLFMIFAVIVQAWPLLKRLEENIDTWRETKRGTEETIITATAYAMLTEEMEKEQNPEKKAELLKKRDAFMGASKEKNCSL